MLTFDTPENLAKARLAFQAQRIEHGQRRIWLDAAKSKAELLPARLVHRAFTCVSSAEAERDGVKIELTKDMPGKQLKTGKTVVGYSLRGEWKWSAFARERYGEELLEILGAWVMAF